MKLLSELLTEKYRPQLLKDMIIPQKEKEIFQNQIEKGIINNLIFYGTAGLGKTSLAGVLVNELDANILYVNASEETSIEMVRDKIKKFSFSKSINRKVKVIILDEADRLSPQAQDSLKAITEKSYKTTRFIFITNNFGKIAQPLISRCQAFNFNEMFSKKNRKEINKQIAEKLKFIFKNEKLNVDVKNNKETLNKLVQKSDFRRILNIIEKSKVENTIDFEIIEKELGFSSGEMNLKEIVRIIVEQGKKLDPINLRQVVIEIPNIDFDIYSEVEKLLVEYLDEKKIKESQFTQSVILLGKYCFYHGNVADYSLNFFAFCIEVSQIFGE